jgi:hypothetical protein
MELVRPAFAPSTRLRATARQKRKRGFYAGVGLIGFKEEEGELKPRLTI